MQQVLFENIMYELGIGIASPVSLMALIALNKKELFTYSQSYSQEVMLADSDTDRQLFTSQACSHNTQILTVHESYW